MEALRIPQKQLAGNEKTVPELSVIRKLLGDHIPLKDVADKDVNFWVQAPPASTEGKAKESAPAKADNNCEVRAKDIANVLKPDPKGYLPKLFQSNLGAGLAAQWTGVDKSVQEMTPVLVKGVDTFVGGDKSVYGTGTSFHVVLFLAAGKETVNEGGKEVVKEFYICFDPDVSATDATRAAWDNAKLGDINHRIAAMVLGTEKEVLGPLCRKYYVNKAKVFPQFARFGVK